MSASGNQRTDVLESEDPALVPARISQEVAEKAWQAEFDQVSIEIMGLLETVKPIQERLFRLIERQEEARKFLGETEQEAVTRGGVQSE